MDEEEENDTLDEDLEELEDDEGDEDDEDDGRHSTEPEDTLADPYIPDDAA